MSLKKLLIIQQDDAYFLFETISVLEKYPQAFKDFELTLLVSDRSFEKVCTTGTPMLKGITTDADTVLKVDYEVSVNLSLVESSWDFHGQIESKVKLGPYRIDGQLSVLDLWSSYLLTLKARAPFLTFHLQDIYRNILGIKTLPQMSAHHSAIHRIAFGFCTTDLFPSSEQEVLISQLSNLFPNMNVCEISEIDLISDLSHTLYIGPATFEALKFSQAGGKGIFLASHFQGLNLLPCSENHLYVSSRGKPFQATEILSLVKQETNQLELPRSSPYSLYRIENDKLSGAYLRSLNDSDDNYPFYQTHVVLWNFLLNLFETSVDITKCNEQQLMMLRNNQAVLSKVLRLHDYAMASVDAIYQESKSASANSEKIEGHLGNLSEIDRLTDQVASTFTLLRPVLDFYRIRRGQNNGSTLREQSQNSLLTYSEEQQALRAMDELFSVTLRKNEVSI